MTHKDLIKFQKLFNNDDLDLNKIFSGFRFFIIENNISKDHEICQIKKRINETKMIIINKIDELIQNIIIIFDRTIILISESDIKLILDTISESKESTIFTYTEELTSIIPTEYEQNIYKYEEYEVNNYNIQIKSFIKNFPFNQSKDAEIKDIFQLFIPSFSMYFINKCYLKHEKERLKINQTRIEKIDLTRKKYFKLQELGQGSSSYIQLIYHIELESLFAIKIFSPDIDDKTFKREFENYMNIEHPFIPKCYGKATINGYNCIILEYIRGKSLLRINDIPLEESD